LLGNPISGPYTIGILANITFPTSVTHSGFKNRVLVNTSQSEVITKNGNLTINVKPFDIVEQSSDFFTRFSVPIAAAATIIAALIGAGKLSKRLKRR
jgi:hypothetical protein